jgi:hypothetical protein
LQKIVSVECFCGNEKKKAFIAESLFSKTGARALIELTPETVAAQRLLFSDNQSYPQSYPHQSNAGG